MYLWKQSKQGCNLLSRNDMTSKNVVKEKLFYYVPHNNHAILHNLSQIIYDMSMRKLSKSPSSKRKAQQQPKVNFVERTTLFATTIEQEAYDKISILYI